MSGFFRPEAVAALIRWREAIMGIAVIGLGTWWSFSSGPVLRWVAVLTILAGGAILWEGLRRARLPQGGGGAGLVEVTERRIAYFAPDRSGGIISVDDLIRVEIRTTGAAPPASGLFWIFHGAGRQVLTIPGDAEGADALFDAIAALPGLSCEQAIEAAGSTGSDSFLIWQKDRRALH